MAITVTHSKVSTIPDGDDTSLIRPSDWNAEHELVGTVPVTNGGTGASTLTGYVKGNGTSAMTASSTIPNTDVSGLGTMSTQNANSVSITGGSISGTTVSGYIPTSAEGVANGVATLDGSGTVPISQLPSAVLGALSYQGTWNASTNTPTLTSSVGTKGYYYVVSVSGSTDLNGITDWVIGDWAVFNGSVWQKIDNTDAVTSVNGLTGTVVLTTTNINEGTNLYYTDARARSALSGGTGISYNSTTGVITNSSPSLGGDVVGPASATDNAIARYDTTTGKLIQNSGVTLDDNANIVGVRSTQYSGAVPATQPIGTMWFDSATDSLNFQQNAITQQIGEELFVYGKASAAITDSPLQIIYHTGVVGASGVITFAPTIAGITDENAIIGVATESIALNGFGRITSFGVVHGINTTGSAYGETWANDDVIWYNPVTGNPTKVKPVAPNIKFQIGLVINAGSGGSGSFQVLLQPGTQLGGTDSNVQLTSVANGNLLTYDGGNGYWKNTDLASGTGISVSKSVNGVLTITNTSPSSGGTVTSVTATAPVVSTGGTTPVISMAAATTSVNGYLTSTDWNTFNGKQAALVSGTNIKTVNGTTLLGSGDLGTIGIAYGGTGQTTANAAFNALAPSQTGNSGKYLTTDGTNTSWATNPLGTVTSVSGTGTVNGLTLTGTVTTSGSLTLGGTLDLSSPPAIGGTTANAITGTTITATKYVGISGGTF